MSSIVDDTLYWGLCNRPTLQKTFDLCTECVKVGVPGAFVECGVFAGAHPAVMASISSGEGKRRQVHLFDSFCGIPESGPNDDESITALIGVGSGRLVSTGISACSVDKVKGHMKKWGVDSSLLNYHVGWFQDTLKPAIEAGNFPNGIAVLRLDGDLYESTKVCLEQLYPLVNQGGYVIIDDYALTGCRKAVLEYREKHNIKSALIEIEKVGPHYWAV